MQEERYLLLKVYGYVDYEEPEDSSINYTYVLGEFKSIDEAKDATKKYIQDEIEDAVDNRVGELECYDSEEQYLEEKEFARSAFTIEEGYEVNDTLKNNDQMKEFMMLIDNDDYYCEASTYYLIKIA